MFILFFSFVLSSGKLKSLRSILNIIERNISKTVDNVFKRYRSITLYTLYFKYYWPILIWIFILVMRLWRTPILFPGTDVSHVYHAHMLSEMEWIRVHTTCWPLIAWSRNISFVPPPFPIAVCTTSPEYISFYCCFLPSSQSALNIKEDKNILEDAVRIDLRQKEDLLPL